EVAVCVEPDQADARGRAVGLLEPADDAREVRAVAAGDHHVPARRNAVGHGSGDLAADATEGDDAIRVSLGLREDRGGEGDIPARDIVDTRLLEGGRLQLAVRCGSTIAVVDLNDMEIHP